MIRIGILGDIGSGKSYVAKSFGYPVFIADNEVGRLYKKDRIIFIKLNKALPKYITKFPIKKRRLKSVKYLRIDLSQKKLFRSLPSNFDYVVNLAGYVDHSDKRKTMQSHFNGCKNLSMFFIDKNVKKFIQIGSSIEYGKLKSPQKENKKNLQKTYSVYGKAKLLSTRFILSLYKRYNYLRLYFLFNTGYLIYLQYRNYILYNDCHH